MQVTAKLKYFRISPKKIRLVTDLVKGMNVEQAQHQLSMLNKKASKSVLKLLNSAIANAENNFELKKNNLFVKNILVDEGQTLKRWKPRAFGRATPIRKRTSRIEIILDEVKPSIEVKKKQTKIDNPQLVQNKPVQAKEDIPITSDIDDIAPATQDDENDKQIIDQTRQGKHRNQQHLDKIKNKSKGGKLNKIFRRKSV